MLALSAKECKALFDYDPKTGLVYYKKRFPLDDRRATKFGTTSPYGRIRHEGESCRSADVVWLMHKGEWPDQVLAHKNGNKRDDRIENLIPSGSTTVGGRPRSNYFMVKVELDGVSYFAGRCCSHEEAQAATDRFMGHDLF